MCVCFEHHKVVGVIVCVEHYKVVGVIYIAANLPEVFRNYMY